MSTAEAEIKTAQQLLAEQRNGRTAPDEAPPGALAIRPALSVADQRNAWNDFLELRAVLLLDPACYDEIEGSRELNRTGATRLAVAFSLSIERVSFDEGRVELADEGKFDYRYRWVLRISRESRRVEGFGSCRLSEIPERSKKGTEIPIGQREHFAATKAWTRAAKRGIADMLGGTEAE